jgi:branched-subunit amino acid aminotransferase/4-amino-4-deoxychorismate lyase
VIPLEEARVAVRDRGFLFGEGVFETIRVARGRPWRLERHLARLAGGARALGFAPPEGAAEAAAALLARFGPRDGALKVIVTAGDPPALAPALILTVAPPRPLPEGARESGVAAGIAAARHDPESPLSARKTLAYLERRLARRAAEAAGHYEAIFLDARGRVAEGAATNVFWAAGGALRTPALSLGILPGIARGAVLEIAAAIGVRAEEGAFFLEDLLASDEAFLTNALAGVLPLREVGGRPIGAGVGLSARPAPGPLTRGFAARLEKLVAMETGA